MSTANFFDVVDIIKQHRTYQGLQSNEQIVTQLIEWQKLYLYPDMTKRCNIQYNDRNEIVGFQNTRNLMDDYFAINLSMTNKSVVQSRSKWNSTYSDVIIDLTNFACWQSDRKHLIVMSPVHSKWNPIVRAKGTVTENWKIQTLKQYRAGEIPDRYDWWAPFVIGDRPPFNDVKIYQLTRN